MNKNLLSLGIAALAAFGTAAPALADTASDQFNREVRSVNRSLQRADIVTETGAGPTQASAGALGRKIEGWVGEAQAADSGSRWFDSYVAQVNQRLRIDRQAETALR